MPGKGQNLTEETLFFHICNLLCAQDFGNSPAVNQATPVLASAKFLLRLCSPTRMEGEQRTARTRTSKLVLGPFGKQYSTSVLEFDKLVLSHEPVCQLRTDGPSSQIKFSGQEPLGKSPQSSGYSSTHWPLNLSYAVLDLHMPACPAGMVASNNWPSPFTTLNSNSICVGQWC